jgi:hypothetical protein
MAIPALDAQPERQKLSPGPGMRQQTASPMAEYVEI